MGFYYVPACQFPVGGDMVSQWVGFFYRGSDCTHSVPIVLFFAQVAAPRGEVLAWEWLLSAFYTAGSSVWLLNTLLSIQLPQSFRIPEHSPGLL